jgi:hypothetical protein
MTDLSDIFRVENNDLRWVESATTLEDVKARARELAVRSPAEYVLLDQKSGNKLVVKIDGTDGTMSDSELKYPEWQTPLQEVMLEFDRERLQEKIQKVEALICERLQQLSHRGDGRREQQAINDALTILRIIKREKRASSPRE